MSGRTIVIGGGLAGLSAAHTVLQAGGSVTMLERNAFMGGNSTKATSGMNGAGTRTQKAMGVPDTTDIFEEDIVRSATGIKTGPKPESYKLAVVLAQNSGAAVEWIQDNFGLALDTVSRLGGHSQPRTHRSKNGTSFPGMEITYALMKKYEALATENPGKVKLITKARVTKLTTDAAGRITGADYEKGGKQLTEQGDAVIISTGGYGAGGLFEGSLLFKVRPDLCFLPTTNGEHCTGDGIGFAQDIGADTVDLQHVQVHPTGLVHLDDPDNRTKFLAAEALRGEGALIIDRDGNRFCNDLGTRDYCSNSMWKHDKAPYRLMLNENSYKNIAWHCKHYCGRRVMAEFNSGAEMCKANNIPMDALAKTFSQYNEYAIKNSDPFGKKYFNGTPWSLDSKFMCATITPVVHYTMGGLAVNERMEVRHTNGKVIRGLYAAGESTGGVHGRNRLGGSALLECVALGRIAGAAATKYVSEPKPAAGGAALTISIPQANGPPVTITIGGASIVGSALDDQVAEPFCGLSAGDDIATIVPECAIPKDAPKPEAAAAPAAAAAAPVQKGGTYTLEEVAKHKTATDVWVVVDGKVLDVTKFLPDHPGGKMAIMAFAGRDATTEFNMVHEAGVVEKYAPETVIGMLAPSSKL